MSRLGAETALYDGWGGLLNFVFAAGNATDRPVTPTGSTTVYNDPLNFALGCLGTPAADPSAVSDGDVARVPANYYYVFIDLATYKLIRNILGNFVDTDESGQDRNQAWSKLADRAQERADALEKQYAGMITPYDRRATSGTMRAVPPTAHLPHWRPGFGRPPGGYSGAGGFWS